MYTIVLPIHLPCTKILRYSVGMRNTLLLVFVHGFKGTDDTFGTFPEHVRALASHALPRINVLAAVYPQYETRGQLVDCVARFQEWLENKVIDLEVANSTSSPTVHPAVHVVLLGHSMGGIVAAETLLSVAGAQCIAGSTQHDGMPAGTTNTSEAGCPPTRPRSGGRPPTTMFPHIRGLLAFDTPFLGLAPQMVAHGLEGGHKMASSAYSAYTEVTSLLGWGGPKDAPDASSRAKAPAGALPPPTMDSVDAAATPRWQAWGKYAMFAGAAGAVAAGGVAALYSQREKISAGWTWASSHLLFVGDLAKAEFLRARVDKLNMVCQQRCLGSVNLYTNLGRGAREGYGLTEQLAGRDRTFCNLPAAIKEGRPVKGTNAYNLRWVKAVNERAKDETSAHVSMFFPKDNPGFYELGEQAREVIVSFVDSQWYESSEHDEHDMEPQTDVQVGSLDRDWEGLDRAPDPVEEIGLHMRDEMYEGTSEVDEDMLGASVIIDKGPYPSVRPGTH